MIRILLADDQALVRSGLRMILEAEAGLQVVGEAEDGRRAVQLAAEAAPDVVLMDIRMPGMDGIEATRELTHRNPDRPRVLILTTFDADEYVYEALKAGASGFLLKSAPPGDLVRAVHVVHEGHSLLAPEVTRYLIEDFVSGPPRQQAQHLPELTARELEVLRLVARGLSNGEIAADLVVTEATVKSHINRIFTKLGLRDRVQAVILAYERGLVRSPAGEAAGQQGRAGVGDTTKSVKDPEAG